MSLEETRTVLDPTSETNQPLRRRPVTAATPAAALARLKR